MNTLSEKKFKLCKKRYSTTLRHYHFKKNVRENLSDIMFSRYIELYWFVPLINSMENKKANESLFRATNIENDTFSMSLNK